MKKIAILTNSVFTCGGEQRVVCIIANELSKLYEVTVYTEDKSFDSNPYDLIDKISVKSFAPFSAGIITKGFRFLFKIPLFSFFRNFAFSWKITHFTKKLATRLRDLLNGKYDTVIAVSDRLTLLLGYAKKYGLDVRTIMWEHNSFECYFRTKNHRCWKQDKLFIETSKYFDECVVLNEDYAEKYKKYLGIDCKVFYNPRSFVSKQKAELNNKTIISCCVLDIEPKGLDLLLDSFEIFAKKNPDWKLLIAGNGTDKSKLEHIVQQKGLGDRVEFLGYRSDVKELLLESSIFVLPSRWEGFPMSLTEAYECGLPVVVYDIPATIPFRKNNDCIVCKSFDTKEYAEALLKLAENFDLRKEIGTNATKFAASISKESIIKKWLEIV